MVGLWASTAPNILPDRVGTHEPGKRQFSPNDLDALLAEWEHNVLFKRAAKPRLQSSVFMQYGPHRKHSSWTIALDDPRNANVEELLKLLERASTEFSADFAFVHKPSMSDVEAGLASGSMTYLNTSKTRLSLFITTHLLRRYVPDIYWVTVFGEPYVGLFSRQRLLTAPAYQVRELANGSVLVQLTESLDASDQALDNYQRRKVLVKEHLNSDVFFDLKKGVNHKYSVPDFVWREVFH